MTLLNHNPDVFLWEPMKTEQNVGQDSVGTRIGPRRYTISYSENALLIYLTNIYLLVFLILLISENEGRKVVDMKGQNYNTNFRLMEMDLEF